MRGALMPWAACFATNAGEVGNRLLAVAYLASPRAGSTTGTALEVDGGMSALRLRPRS
jgi:hypothetical protein